MKKSITSKFEEAKTKCLEYAEEILADPGVIEGLRLIQNTRQLKSFGEIVWGNRAGELRDFIRVQVSIVNSLAPLGVVYDKFTDAGYVNIADGYIGNRRLEKMSNGDHHYYIEQHEDGKVVVFEKLDDLTEL